MFGTWQLWRAICEKNYPRRYFAGPPVSRQKIADRPFTVFGQRVSYPASREYYGVIDRVTQENVAWMAINYNGRADRVLHTALDSLTASSQTPAPKSYYYPKR